MPATDFLEPLQAMQTMLAAVYILDTSASLYPPDAKVPDESSYDYVVVGGGLAGSVVSARLVEAGHSVLVIEAGVLPSILSSFPDSVITLRNSRVDWNYTAEAERNTDGCHKSRQILVPKAFGGAVVVSVDYMIYSRGNPSNFDNWSKDDTWKYNNLLKYFKKSEDLQDPNILGSPYKKFHGINGTITITKETDKKCDKYIKGFERAGQPVPIDNVGNGSLGYSRGLYYILHGVRTGVSSYITPLKDNPKIHLSLKSFATKIIFDEKKNAIGVRFIKNGTPITVKAKKEVIICAGPIKSPQLLMLSGIGPKKHLKQWNITSLSDLPVGRNFQNIIGTLLAFKTNKKANPDRSSMHLMFNFPFPVIVGYSATNKSSKYPDYESLIFIVDDYISLLSFCSFTLDFKNKICDRLSLLGNSTQLAVTILSNLKVKSNGKILLNSANPKDPPKIIPGYYSNDEDLDAIVEDVQHYMKVISTPYFKDMGLEFIDPTSKCSQLKKGSREYWKCYVLCMTAKTSRYVGTNSMGAVVDSKLRVYGMNKLRVADASIIPNIIGGTTTATIIAVAEKAAELIISQAKV